MVVDYSAGVTSSQQMLWQHKNVLPPEELKQRIEQAFFKYEKAHATVCLKESAAMGMIILIKLISTTCHHLYHRLLP
jgi:N-formylglutamate amidohydrolase